MHLNLPAPASQCACGRENGRLPMPITLLAALDDDILPVQINGIAMVSTYMFSVLAIIISFWQCESLWAGGVMLPWHQSNVLGPGSSSSIV